MIGSEAAVPLSLTIELVGACLSIFKERYICQWHEAEGLIAEWAQFGGLDNATSGSHFQGHIQISADLSILWLMRGALTLLQIIRGRV